MKYARYSFICLVLLLFVVACKKDSIFDEYGFYGEGSAMLNGKPWKGITGVFPKKNFCSPGDTCLAISLLYYNDHGALRSIITFDVIPLNLGKHTINYVWPTWEEIEYRLIYSEYVFDGDVTTGGYHVYEQNDANYLNLTELNVQTGDVRGEFQAVVVRDSMWTPAGYAPDTIRITDGSFYGKIYWN